MSEIKIPYREIASDWPKIKVWLLDNVGKQQRDWMVADYHSPDDAILMWFKKEASAVAFKLRWCN